MISSFASVCTDRRIDTLQTNCKKCNSIKIAKGYLDAIYRFSGYKELLYMIHCLS